MILCKNDHRHKCLRSYKREQSNMSGMSMTECSLFSECSSYRILSLHNDCNISFNLSDTMNDSFLFLLSSSYRVFFVQVVISIMPLSSA